MFLNRAGVTNHFSHKVRVGNWSEEQELEEVTHTHMDTDTRREEEEQGDATRQMDVKG